MLWLLLFISVALIGFSAIAVLNTLTFPRLRLPASHLRAPASGPQPSVSILIPARNEAAVIGRAVRALLDQQRVSLEVIVLDDHSQDGTRARALVAAGGDPRLRVIPGQPLPPGWLGKNWACHQLAQAAAADLLLFADADVIWQPGSLGALLAEFRRSRADVLTVWPTQLTATWGERLVVPLMALAVIAYLPVLAVHHLPGRVFSAAVGQCLLFRRIAYDHVGGHAGVRGQIVEDVALAARVKGAGLRLRMTDGAGLIACRMYQGWAQVRDGFAKNILAGHGNRPALLLVSTLFHWSVFVLPWLLLVGLGTGRPGFWSVWPVSLEWAAGLAGLGVLVRALTAAVTRQRVVDALCLPASVGLMTLIAAQALWWHFRGGPRWKGRVARQAV